MEKSTGSGGGGRIGGGDSEREDPARTRKMASQTDVARSERCSEVLRKDRLGHVSRLIIMSLTFRVFLTSRLCVKRVKARKPVIGC